MDPPMITARRLRLFVGDTLGMVERLFVCLSARNHRPWKRRG